ncbi:MAG: hypothetical protein ACR2LT_07145, partial [Pyrinomonadaceae bacterium]
MAENLEDSQNSSKQTFTGLAKRLSRLSSDKRRAALEVSASLAGVSLRASREFVEAVPRAAKILAAEDLRLWGEMGRRLAMANADAGAKFFADGVADFKRIPAAAHSLIFQICTRQLVLSSSIALETFQTISALAGEISDDELLSDILKVANEIAQRSAKHSADFLKATPPVAEKLKYFDTRKPAQSVINLAFAFASRTGGMTADLWQLLPVALKNLTAEQTIRLTEKAIDFLEFGGSVTLHFVSAGGEVLRRIEKVFDEWCEVLLKIAAHGNAVLIAFLRSSPKLFAQIVSLRNQAEVENAARRVLLLIGEIAETDAESALAAFRSSASALRKVSLIQFEDWIRAGLEKDVKNQRARRSYFALETRR